MFDKLRLRVVLFIPVCLATCLAINGASAITVEVAKKCEGLSAKMFPPREIGNPAAGLIKGTAQSKRNYFNKCVANGGKMDDDVQGKK